jgi:hypothetical protein
VSMVHRICVVSSQVSVGRRCERLDDETQRSSYPMLKWSLLIEIREG